MPKKTLGAIELEDITKYRFPGNLKYSPDGKLLAFNATRSDVEKNCYHSDVFLIRDGSCTQVTYSMDASFVDFENDTTLILRRRTPEAQPGTTELFLLDVNGGEAKPWITLPFGMNRIRKVADGLYAATGSIDSEDPDAYKDDADTRKKKAEEKKKDADYQVVDEVPYWFNGAGFTNKRRTALFLVKTAPALEVRRLTAPKFNVGDMKVHGTKVFYTGNVKEMNQARTAKIFSYDTKTNKAETIYGKNDHKISTLLFFGNDLYAMASDMKQYGTNETDSFCKVSKNKLEPLCKPEVRLANTVGSDTVHGAGDGNFNDGKYYITLATIEDHNAVFCYDKKLKKTVLWEASGMADCLTVSDDKIALIYQPWDKVAEVYEMNRDGSDMKQLTDLNGEMLKGRYVAKPNVVDYKSEGYDLRGWVLLPQNFDKKKKYPAVLDIHGGPRTVYGETFFHEMQLWAARGYVVFFTNIKGSDGRGDDFADIRDDYGGTDFRNLMDFTDAVLKKYPNIDTTKICETGGSYGGFMTNWIIGHTDRFCCAASQRSISNWISFSFISDIGLYFGPDQNGTKGLFGDANTEQMWNHSPLKYAENVKTPTLFIHSDEDYRCPLPEGMQMMQALAYRNIETRMCIFHGENHELSRSGKPQHRIRRLQEIADWFDKHTK